MRYCTFLNFVGNFNFLGTPMLLKKSFYGYEAFNALRWIEKYVFNFQNKIELIWILNIDWKIVFNYKFISDFIENYKTFLIFIVWLKLARIRNFFQNYSTQLLSDITLIVPLATFSNWVNWIHYKPVVN